MMRIPRLEQIEFESKDPKSLKAILRKARVGTTPLYIDCSEMTTSQLTPFLLQLSKVLEEMDINPFFPYPVYIINANGLSNSDFPVLPSEKYLPDFYQQKAQRLKSKEQLLLNKVEMQAEKMKNRNISETLEFMKGKAKKQRRLYDLNHEESFLLKVREQLEKAIREES